MPDLQMSIYVILRNLPHFLNLSFPVYKSAVEVPIIKICSEGAPGGLGLGLSS